MCKDMGVNFMWYVHDSIIESYQVNFEDELLIINTKYDDNIICEKTEVIFTGYLTHIFYNEMKNSIILDIEECRLNSFFEDERELLEERRKCGWPIMYETENDLFNYLHANKYKAFIIYASLGLNGWVLAKKIDYVNK